MGEKKIKELLHMSVEIDLSAPKEIFFRPNEKLAKKRKRINDSYDLNDVFLDPMDEYAEVVDLECRLDNMFIYSKELPSDPKRIIKNFNRKQGEPKVRNILYEEYKSKRGKCDTTRDDDIVQYAICSIIMEEGIPDEIPGTITTTMQLDRLQELAYSYLERLKEELKVYLDLMKSFIGLKQLDDAFMLQLWKCQDTLNRIYCIERIIIKGRNFSQGAMRKHTNSVINGSLRDEEVFKNWPIKLTAFKRTLIGKKDSFGFSLNSELLESMPQSCSSVPNPL